MEIKIQLGSLEHLSACKNAILDSMLAKRYLFQEPAVIKFLENGLTSGEIFVALSTTNECVGYIWIDFKGVFGEFPYVKSLAVHKNFRSKGVGKRLLSHFEEMGFQQSSKLFLLVSEFNTQAKKLYMSQGYRELAIIPGIYSSEINELLMMKIKPS